VSTAARVILAEYDAENRVLKLVEPLRGVEDHERVRITIERAPSDAPTRPWASLRGSLPAEAAEAWRSSLTDAARPDDA
jgi:hypothetical protein